MAVVADIVSMDEVQRYLGLEQLNDDECAPLSAIHKWTERVVRRWLGTNVVQTTYTHVLNPIGARPWHSHLRHDLMLDVISTPEYPIRSVTTLWEDENALGGAASGAFPVTSQLTEGSDFYLDITQSGLCRWGRIRRKNNVWPSTPGSVKVTYSAGWSAAELSGQVSDPGLDASDVQLAVLKAIGENWNEAINTRAGVGVGGGGGGPIKSERLADYSVAYDTSHSGPGTSLSQEVRHILQKFRRVTT